MDSKTFDDNWPKGNRSQLLGESGLFGDILVGEPDRCVFASSFHDYASRLCQEVTQGPSDVKINQAMLLIAKRYLEWFSVVPKRHRYHLSENGHTCIFQVFVQTFQQLMSLELSISPPRLFLPAPPPPRQPAEFRLWLGDEEG